MNETLQKRIEEAAAAIAPFNRMSQKRDYFVKGANFALQNQWISVDEDSPKESGTYFIKTKIGYGIAIYGCNGGWFDIDGKPFTKITHWMEIPTLQPSEQLP